MFVKKVATHLGQFVFIDPYQVNLIFNCNPMPIYINRKLHWVDIEQWIFIKMSRKTRFKY